MRRYIAKIELQENNKHSIGQLGEFIFKYWFEKNFNREILHKQSADRDYEGIDFACNKGYTYQVKTTKEKTFTFNCKIENLKDHLRADYYVFIQIIDGFAYIEEIRDSEYVLNNSKQSYHYDNTFIWAKSLDTKQVNLNQLKLL